MMRLRKIWAEGSFSVLKREHCLSKVRKRGIPAVTEECLLSAMALNLKRMAKAILLTSLKLKMWTENIYFQSTFLFCQQVQSLTLPIGKGNTEKSAQIECVLHRKEIGIWMSYFGILNLTSILIDTNRAVVIG